ncbi:ABC transporter ATP-binding protein [Eubacterium xylanophilum]|uniref:ABC transporter ATP-binding protein n=1 Tax=Eubacterium xylanophilum TaxID=39497 RepID=UPI00047EDF27|nr:ABC transporter ATP-binding protein [Eubacterium xylanophilum]
MKTFIKYARPYIKYFILGPLFMLVEIVGDVFMPKLMSLIINEGVQAGRGSKYIILMGILMVLVAFLMMLGGVMAAYFAVKAAVNFAGDLRRDTFKKIQTFSFSNIEKFSTGSLVTRLTNDITNVQNIIVMLLRICLRAPGLLIGGLIMAISINARLAIVLGVVIPILVVALVTVVRVAFPRFEKMQEKLDSLNSRIQENITNVRVVKSFVRDDFEKETFNEANETLVNRTLAAMNVVILTLPIMTFAMNIATMAVLWFGGNQVMNGEMKVGDLTAFTTYIVQILMSLMILGMIFIQGSRSLASAKRINEVLTSKVDLNDDNSSEKDKVVSRGEIEFRDVCFRYYKKHKNNVLKNISFKAYPGETVGIIGSTGSGKTSLVQLIPRLYDVDSGEVLVDGTNVKEYSIENLRNGVGMVLQKNTLFSGSIMENLRWGDKDATDEEVYEMARYAQADKFVKDFTDGYDMELGQGGVNVSGGQKQRLCIARALLRKPKILILDDSTSAVDTATEAEIRKAFDSELKETTKLIIAQRISSVENADRIIVMDEGAIVGIGNHKELLKTCEEYKEIYYSQKDKDEEVSA